MQPIDIAWQLLRKAAGIEGPVDPRRPGMSPGMNPQTGHIQQQDSLPPEAYEQVDQALAEEARLREEGMTSEGAHTPSTPPLPPAYQRSMRRASPTPEELGGDDVSGLPPHLQRAYAQYANQRSTRGPSQGTSAQNPDDVLRSMSPIELAMDALQKKTPRSYRGEPGYERFAEHAITHGADDADDQNPARRDYPYDDKEYQEFIDSMDEYTDEEYQDYGIRPSEIPIEDLARQHQLDVGRQEAMREGVDIQQTRTPPADVRFRRPEEVPTKDSWAIGGRDLNETPRNPFKMGPSL